MKILVIGGMHGNEMLGIDLVRSLRKHPMRGVDCVLANEVAVTAKKRYMKQDLNRSFPGSKISSDYEQQRAAELLAACQNYDVVFDFHNTHCPNNDCTFVGDNANVNLFSVSQSIGLPRVIVADYNCINKFAPNCISVEISLQSELNNVRIWRQKLQELRNRQLFTDHGAVLVERFRFVYRMTLEDKERLGLDQKKLQAFQPVDPLLATKMGVKNPAYPIFINDRFTPYNYGGLLNKI